MTTVEDEFSRAEAAAQFLLSKIPLRPKIGLILGSGLGSLADELTQAVTTPYTGIPNFPRSTAIGHAGQMLIGYADKVAVAAMQGRVHLNRGNPRPQAPFPFEVFQAMGLQRWSIPNPPAGFIQKTRPGRRALIAIPFNCQGR